MVIGICLIVLGFSYTNILKNNFLGIAWKLYPKIIIEIWVNTGDDNGDLRMVSKLKIRIINFTILVYLILIGMLIIRGELLGIYFIAALVIEILLISYWSYLILKVRIKIKQDQRVQSANNKPQSIEKDYDYYCPNCLYQSNINFKLCPKCKTGTAIKIKV